MNSFLEAPLIVSPLLLPLQVADIRHGIVTGVRLLPQYAEMDNESFANLSEWGAVAEASPPVWQLPLLLLLLLRTHRAFLFSLAVRNPSTGKPYPEGFMPELYNPKEGGGVLGRGVPGVVWHW